MAVTLAQDLPVLGGSHLGCGQVETAPQYTRSFFGGFLEMALLNLA